MAFRTGLGALAGTRAVPPGCSWAFPFGAVGVVVVLPGDPVPPVWAMAGTAAASEATSTPAIASLVVVFDRKPFSFVGLRG
jgi:hypothetical protein